MPPLSTAQIFLLTQINTWIDSGYDSLENREMIAVCKTWLKAWESLKMLVTEPVSTREDVRQAYPGLHPEFENWCMDLMFELWNAGLHDPAYHEARLRYIDEFLVRFPREDDDLKREFGRGKGESLWALGRREEAEAAFAELVDLLPDDGWAYIGWSDQYWLLNSSPKDYIRGEALLQRALRRPRLNDRLSVLERLAELYQEWGKNAEEHNIKTEIRLLQGRAVRPNSRMSAGKPSGQTSAESPKPKKKRRRH